MLLFHVFLRFVFYFIFPLQNNLHAIFIIIIILNSVVVRTKICKILTRFI